MNIAALWLLMSAASFLAFFEIAALKSPFLHIHALYESLFQVESAARLRKTAVGLKDPCSPTLESLSFRPFMLKS